MHDRYPHILTPLQLTDRVRLKNRAYFAPMGIDVAHPDGTASSELLDFYGGIIRGGAGLVVLGNASIHPSTRLQSRGLCLHNQAQAEALTPLFALAQQQNCQVVIQLQHYGAQGSTALTGQPLLSPSGVPCQRMQAKDPDYAIQAMSKADIKQVRQQFVHAAGLAKQAGANLIQLQASNGYLLSSFLSPYTNKRRDAYGGTGHKRMQLLCEVIEDIQTHVPDLGVSVRLGMDDGLGHAGQYPELLLPHLHRLEKLNICALTVSISIGETFHLLLTSSEETKACFARGIALIRQHWHAPLGFAGLIDSLESAEAACQTLSVDLVGMTRAIFADNDLIHKSIQGRHADIQQCRFDGNCFRDKANPAASRVFCCVNPNYLRPTHIKY